MNPIVSSARTYMGTRFRHRGRNRTGLDCAGLVWAAYHDNGIDLPDFRLYSKEPSAHDKGLTQYMVTALGKSVSEAPVHEIELEAGDIVVLRFEVEPHHVGIITEYPYGGFALLHACGHNKKVIEHRLSPDMIKRITHVFRRPV